MPRITLAPYGSLGDLHPFLAIALELRERGHEIRIATLEPYREKLEILDFEHFTLRPTFDPEDREAAREVMDERYGSETLITDYILPAMEEMYEDLLKAVEGSDLFVPGEVVFAAKSVAATRTFSPRCQRQLTSAMTRAAIWSRPNACARPSWARTPGATSK